ncbi:MAG: polysaccharide biosynthesis C-terminal domain-containing protein [Planctomycetes bacterium]|nr:polysaccharide biosynthesis C-terminal domain-containing protein [Planctomycetota bacterium]
MFKNIGSTWILNLLQIAVVLILAPFVLQRLGNDQNGVWVTIVSYTGILSLLILGVPMASVRFVAEQVAKKDVVRMNAAISTCLVICTGLGAAALLVGAVLWFVFDTQYLNGATAASLPPGTTDGASLAFAMVAVQVAFAFAMRLPYGIFDAYSEFVARNVIMAGELVLRVVATVALLSWNASLPALALVQILSMLFEFALTLAVLKRRHPEVRFSYHGFDRSTARAILGFSVFALLLNVGTLLAFRVDAIVISSYLEPAHATFFDVGNKFFDPLTGLVISVGAVVMPLATRLKATAGEAELRDVFMKWSKICLSIVLMIGVYLLVAGPDFLGWWVGAEFVEPSGRVLQVLMLSFLFYLPVRGVALPILMGLGRPKAPALGLLAMGVVNVGISLALVSSLGIFGVALGTAIPNLMFAVFVLVLACRELSIPLRSYAGYVVVRAAIGALVPLAALWLYRSEIGLDSLVKLVGAGILSVTVFALTWIFFVYRNDPHLDLSLLRRRVGSDPGVRRQP